MPFIPEQTEKPKFINHYLKLEQGFPVTIQILEDATQKFQHWMKTSDKPKGFPVPCLGYRDCPICLRNRSLGENYKDHPEYIPVQKRYMVNVVDLTPCKRSGDEVYIAMLSPEGKLVFPTKDSHGNSLENVPVTPVNEVKILERGPELFEKKLKPLTTGSVTDSDENPLTIQEFPIVLTLTGSGRNTDIGAVPKPGSKLTIKASDYSDKLVDLNAGLRFTEDEITAMLAGTTFSDVMAARTAMKEISKSKDGNLGGDIEY